MTTCPIRPDDELMFDYEFGYDPAACVPEALEAVEVFTDYVTMNECLIASDIREVFLHTYERGRWGEYCILGLIYRAGIAAGKRAERRRAK